MLLEAYYARENNDYRKVIIDCASALEVCLNERIKIEFVKQGIPFGEKLLKKFRMLSGLFELIVMLGFKLPKKNYDKLIIETRNRVIHCAAIPTEAQANQAITEVRELIQLLTPQIH
jgi:hypothetical protein